MLCGFVFAVAKYVFMFFMEKDSYFNMVKTSYCELAEKKKFGCFLENEPKIDLQSQRKENFRKARTSRTT